MEFGNLWIHLCIVYAAVTGEEKEYIYWPQRSWAKVIFSQVCVKNSVQRGGWVCLSACWDAAPNSPGLDPQSRHPLGADLPRSRHPRVQTPPPRADPLGVDPPGADTPREQTLPRELTPAYGQRAAGTHPTGMHSCLFM